MKSLQRASLLVSTLVSGVLLTGCATGKIEQVKVGLPSNQIAKTDPIYVKVFDASKAVFKGEFSDVADKVAAQRVRVPQIIAEETIKHLTGKGYPAQSYSANAPGNAIIVEGEVTLVDAGSGAARFWVGLGAGASTVRANVKVYRANDPVKPMAELQMAGHSGGTGGIWGYQDWIGANSRDLAIKLADYLMGKK